MSTTPIPLPSSTPASTNPTPHRAIVIDDERSVMRLVQVFVERAGVSQAELARRMGIKPQSFSQYLGRRRVRPSLQWMARLALVCGGRLWVEFPNGAINPFQVEPDQKLDSATTIDRLLNT